MKEFQEMRASTDLLAGSPLTEPERQFFFIDKCHEIIEDQTRQLGRPLKAAVINFGCQMNAWYPHEDRV